MSVTAVVSQPSRARGIMDRYARLKNINPVGGDNVDPFAVYQPAEEKGIITLRWARLDRVQYKKSRYFAELVPCSEHEKYRLSADACDKTNNMIFHAFDKKLVLMRYANPDLLELRMLIPAMTAIKTTGDAIKEFESRTERDPEGDHSGRAHRAKRGYLGLNEALADQSRRETPLSLTNSTTTLTGGSDLQRLASEIPD